MPELPEVSTIVEQLKKELVGKTITGMEIRLARIWQGSRDQVLGAKITDVKRRAKMIIIKLNNGKNLVVHLKMTGQLVYSDQENIATFPNPIPFAGTTLPGKTTHIIFHLSHGTLFYNDMRQFGWVHVYNNEELREKIDGELGPEPFDFAQGKPTDFTPEYLAKICSNWGRPIKLLLLEQSKIAGIGNIYANEALWSAGISPMKRGREVPEEKIKDLYKAIREVLELGLKYHGSSAGDEAYVDAYGHGGQMQNHTVVYQKAGSECPRCHHKIVRSTIGGRGTFFCPKCQK